LGDLVDWYCTINEPGNVALGYLGALGFPPGTTTMSTWEAAIDGLCKGVVRSRRAAKQARPEAKVGATHAMIEFEENDAGRPLVDFFRDRMEDRFLEASSEDDFLGVQTYTRVVIAPPSWSAPLVRALTELGPVRRSVVPWLFRRVSRNSDAADNSTRTTDMGYEYRPQAIAATVRRAHELLPNKPLVVTEHGIATTNDPERIEFVRDGLAALHELIEDGVPLLGYIYWSAFDNFEWALGYRMQFGLIGVDRSTQERVVKPSARFLGEIAKANAVVTD
jgi:beta-glucosidase